MTIVFEYVTAPTTETVHLARQDELVKTLCGRSTVGMKFGDETLSGVNATCRACRKNARKS